MNIKGTQAAGRLPMSAGTNRTELPVVVLTVGFGNEAIASMPIAYDL